MNLDHILKQHKLWLETNTKEGARANLSNVDLSFANLSGVNLMAANLSCANLKSANLKDVNLSGVNLKGAQNIPDIVYVETLIVPQEGSIIGWKKCKNDVIVKLEIPDGVPRHNATGRKCRAERAIVLDVIGAEYGISKWNAKFFYRKGETVIADFYDPDRWEECGPGIHFYITRTEAENHL